MSEVELINPDNVSSESSDHRRIIVAEISAGRYDPGFKPLSWDDRRPAIESITTTEGEEIKLFSSSGQSTPKTGWILMLVGKATEKELSQIPNLNDLGNGSEIFSWTLYGIQKI